MFPIHRPFIIDVIVHIVRVELTNSIVEFRLWDSRLNCDFATSSSFYCAFNLVLCFTVGLAGNETILSHFQWTNGVIMLNCIVPVDGAKNECMQGTGL